VVNVPATTDCSPASIAMYPKSLNIFELLSLGMLRIELWDFYPAIAKMMYGDRACSTPRFSRRSIFLAWRELSLLGRSRNIDVDADGSIWDGMGSWIMQEIVLGEVRWP
jgi:hypothetical protein